MPAGFALGVAVGAAVALVAGVAVVPLVVETADVGAAVGAAVFVVLGEGELIVPVPVPRVAKYAPTPITTTATTTMATTSNALTARVLFFPKNFLWGILIPTEVCASANIKVQFHLGIDGWVERAFVCHPSLAENASVKITLFRAK